MISATVRHLLILVCSFNSSNKTSGSIFFGYSFSIQITSSVLYHKRWAFKVPHIPNVTPHGLRHTFVSDLLNEGVNDWNIKALVGHAQTSNMIYEVYGHMTERGRKENIEAIHTLEDLRK